MAVPHCCSWTSNCTRVRVLSVNSPSSTHTPGDGITTPRQSDEALGIFPGAVDTHVHTGVDCARALSQGCASKLHRVRGVESVLLEKVHPKIERALTPLFPKKECLPLPALSFCVTTPSPNRSLASKLHSARLYTAQRTDTLTPNWYQSRWACWLTIAEGAKGLCSWPWRARDRCSSCWVPANCGGHGVVTPPAMGRGTWREHPLGTIMQGTIRYRYVLTSYDIIDVRLSYTLCIHHMCT